MVTETLISVEKHVWIKLGQAFRTNDSESYTYEFYLPQNQIADTYFYLEEAFRLLNKVKIKVVDKYKVQHKKFAKQSLEFSAEIVELSLVLPNLNRVRPILKIELKF